MEKMVEKNHVFSEYYVKFNMLPKKGSVKND